MTEAHEVIEFELSKELKEKLRGIFYDTDSNFLNLYIKSEQSKSSPLKCNVDKSSMRNTLEQFNEIVDGTLDQKTKLLCVYSINNHLIKYIEFNTTEQKWYSETFPNDPSLEQKKEQKDTKRKDNNKEEGEPKRKKIAINKYSGNGRLPLHESVVIGDVSKFATLKNTGAMEQSSLFSQKKSKLQLIPLFQRVQSTHKHHYLTYSVQRMNFQST